MWVQISSKWVTVNSQKNRFHLWWVVCVWSIEKLANFCLHHLEATYGCDTKNSAMAQTQIKGLIMTDPAKKKPDYQISSAWCLPYSISFCSFFSQHRGLVQLMLTPVDIWSNICGVWIRVKQRLMVVSCPPANMSHLISKCPTLIHLQADIESILTTPLANRKSPRQFAILFFSQMYTL